MAIGDSTRINTNIAAFNALNALKSVNRNLEKPQLKLATGLRINEVSDDPAGFVISKRLVARSRGLSVALDNVGTAKNVLSIAEGGLLSISDILIRMKELVTQAASDTLSFSITQNHGAASLSVASGDVSNNITNSSSAASALSNVNSAIDLINTSLQQIGATISRLTVKETTLSISTTNTEATKARILDADIAKEQLESTRFQILQQTATAQLAQSNVIPQNVLALFT